MPRIRGDIFLATKTGDRDAEGAWASVNRSLERLQTDHVDLIQLHAVGDLDELDKVTGRGGALEAALRAVDEGLAGAVGITGHGDQAPATHLEALRRHPFATVLTPMNVVLHQDAAFRAAYEELADEVARQDAGADAHQDRRPAELAGPSRRALDGRGPRVHDLVPAVGRPAHHHRRGVVGAVAARSSPASRLPATCGCSAWS